MELIAMQRGWNIKNEIGNTYGSLTVTSRAPSKRTGHWKTAAFWNCICSCGNTRTVEGSKLRSGKAKRCLAFLNHNPKAAALAQKAARKVKAVAEISAELALTLHLRKRQSAHEKAAFLGLARSYAVRRLGLSPNLKTELGKVYGHLTVVSRDLVRISKVAYWNCICICGKERVYSGTYLRLGYVTSCGCQPKSDLQLVLNAAHLLNRGAS